MESLSKIAKSVRWSLAIAGSICLLSAESSSFEFVVIGDMPYNPVAGGVQVYPSPSYNRLIGNVNENKKMQFVIHVGDIKAGNTRCDDNVYSENLALFNTFSMPVIVTPGDNEWTDCHRANNGGYDPIGRLALFRSTFYPNDQSLGQTKITLTRQAGYPENAMWQHNGVQFATIHMPGSNNNRSRTSSADTEYTARNDANLLWLDQVFANAASPNILGVFIAAQANPFERFLEPGQGYVVSGYADFIASLRAKTLALGKPVVYAGGDTHYFRIDHPLTGTYPACTSATGTCEPVPVPTSPTDRVNKFTRVEVFAQNDVHWIKVGVDPGDPNVFYFSPQIVPGN